MNHFSANRTPKKGAFVENEQKIDENELTPADCNQAILPLSI